MFRKHTDFRLHPHFQCDILVVVLDYPVLLPSEHCILVSFFERLVLGIQVAYTLIQCLYLCRMEAFIDGVCIGHVIHILMLQYLRHLFQRISLILVLGFRVYIIDFDKRVPVALEGSQTIIADAAVLEDLA